ncbi:MAG TPA: 50S ribosomal protein L6 [Candidatus Moranbacteria bacterium]|nr:50S ribosomal protein L6 [Candidatus Moranbacteria bacterium]
MSRIGKKPIEIPEGIKIEIKDNKMSVSGPKGKLEMTIVYEIKVEIKDNLVYTSRKQKTKRAAAMWGTTSRLISNMIKGVSEGFEKTLELNGVGFRMALKGKQIDMALGFSHPVEVDIPEGLEVKIDKNNLIVSGIDKQAVGQFAAEIRALKPVEPYKGKGFKYSDEIVRRKEGKKAVASE